MTGLGAPGGSTEGGEEEFDELRFSWERNSWISACKSAICLRASSNCPRASSKAARSWPHSGQEATGLAGGSFMYDKDTEVARNCKVFNDHQALSRIIDARGGTERLQTMIAPTPIPSIAAAGPRPCKAAPSNEPSDTKAPSKSPIRPSRTQKNLPSERIPMRRRIIEPD